MAREMQPFLGRLGKLQYIKMLITSLYNTENYNYNEEEYTVTWMRSARGSSIKNVAIEVCESIALSETLSG